MKTNSPTPKTPSLYNQIVELRNVIDEVRLLTKTNYSNLEQRMEVVLDELLEVYNKDTHNMNVGDPCTVCYGSDRYPYEISKIVNVKTVEVVPMDFKLISGSEQTGNEVYQISSKVNKPSGSTVRKNTKGIWKLENSQLVVFTNASVYQDPSF